MTGKRVASSEPCSTSSLTFAPRQDRQGYCALNAITNAFLAQSRSIPADLYDALFARGPLFALENSKVVALLQPSGQAEFQKPEGVRAGKALLCFLQQQKDGPGVFAVEFNGIASLGMRVKNSSLCQQLQQTLGTGFHMTSTPTARCLPLESTHVHGLKSLPRRPICNHCQKQPRRASEPQ